MTRAIDTGRILAVGAAVVAGLAVAVSIWLDPPSENRARRLDVERGWRLNSIENSITGYYRNRQTLPANLEDLEAENRYFNHDTRFDPETGKPFEYEVLGEKDYRLCATFERSSDGNPRTSLDTRKHKAGRDCFEQKVVLPPKL